MKQGRALYYYLKKTPSPVLSGLKPLVNPVLMKNLLIFAVNSLTSSGLS
jgi:hypothetical protein